MSRRNVIVFASVWAVTPSMLTPRHYHSAVRVESGKVLVAGGLQGAAGKPLSSAELYDPKTNSWSSAGAMAYARSQFGLVAIANGIKAGQVVAVGGAGAGLNAELYDPKTNTWKAIAPLKSPKPLMQLVPTSSWVVAISGSSVERWNSYDDTWTDVPPPSGNPYTLTAIPMSDGRIFVLHGLKDAGGVCTGEAEILDPKTWTWSTAAPLSPARCSSLVEIAGGKIMAVGGYQSTGPLTDVDIYEPKTNTWTKSALVPAYHDGRIAVLGSGKVLVAGGFYGGMGSDLAELFDPATGTWSNAPKLTVPRQLTTLTPLLSGGALAAGGMLSGVDQPNGEVFDETGKTCTNDEDCPGHACVDGVCCDRKCDGQCEACDVAGKVGTCGPVTGKPHGMRMACSGGAASCNEGTYSPGGQCDGKGACTVGMPQSCGVFGCDVAKGCLTECNTNAECAIGYICKSRACVKGCSQDLASAIASDGTEVACGAYLCDPAQGKCRESCNASSECAPGMVCDPGSSKCVGTAGTDDSGGCVLGSPPAPAGSAIAIGGVLGLALGAIRRRSRR